MPGRSPRRDRARFKTVEAPESETTLDGNQVVLEDQMMKMTEARMDYDAAIGFYQKSLSHAAHGRPRAGPLRTLGHGLNITPRLRAPPWRSPPPPCAPSRRACGSSPRTWPTPTPPPRTPGGDPYRRQAPVFEPTRGRRGGQGRQA